jgi:hypothetical protein
MRYDPSSNQWGCKMRFALLLALLAFAAPISAQAPEDAQPADEPKLGIEIENARVRDALTKINEVTGEEHTSEGFVGDLSVSIFVHDPSPEKIRAAMKDLLYLHWRERDRDGKTQYVLWQDGRGRALQQQLANQLAAERSPQRYHQSLIEAYDKAATLDKAGLEKLKKEEPFAYIMATTPAGRGLRDLLVYLGPDAFAAVGPGEHYEIPYSQLTPDGQYAVRQFGLSMRGFLSSFMPEMTREAGDVDWSKVEVQIDGPQEEEMPDGSGTVHFGGGVGLNGPGTSGMEFPLLDPYSPEARAIARTILRVMGGELPPEEADKEFEAALVSEWNRGKAAAQRSAASERKIPEELQRVVEIDLGDGPGRKSFEAFPGILAKAAGVDVYADAYPDPRWTNVAAFGGSRPLWKTLDLVAANARREWTYEDGAIILRDKRWYEKRAWIVPEAWFKRWWKTLGDRKEFGFGEICTMATEVSDDQARHGLSAEQKLYTAGMRRIAARPWEYRLYGVLSSEQVLAAEGGGLPLSALSPEQFRVYSEALRHRGRRADAMADTWLRIEKNEGSVRLKLSTTRGADEIEIDLPTP